MLASVTESLRDFSVTINIVACKPDITRPSKQERTPKKRVRGVREKKYAFEKERGRGGGDGRDRLS